MVAWNYADGFTPEENAKNAQAMKTELENLINLIDGIVSIKLYTDPLSSSDSDLLLDSTFDSEEVLKAYIVHPEHVRVGSSYVKPFVKNRKCIDLNI
jgi:hypothetical protein